MLTFFIIIYAISAAIVGRSFWLSCFSNQPYVTLKEATLYLLVVGVPVVNTFLAGAILWDAIDGIVIWKRNK